MPRGNSASSRVRTEAERKPGSTKAILGWHALSPRRAWWVPRPSRTQGVPPMFEPCQKKGEGFPRSSPLTPNPSPSHLAQADSLCYRCGGEGGNHGPDCHARLPFAQCGILPPWRSSPAGMPCVLLSG